VVALSQQTHLCSIKNLQDLAIRRQLVGVLERLARDWHQLRVEKTLPDPIRASMAFVLVVRP
jgi:hypothetical protein